MRRGLVATASRALWPVLARRGETTAWSERWRECATPPAPVDLWLHGASVGEIAPYVDVLRTAAPRVGITVTSGRGLAAVRARCGDFAQVLPLPLPYSPAMAQLHSAWRPRRLVLCEADVWPDLLAAVPAMIPSVAVVAGRVNTMTAPAWRAWHKRDRSGRSLHGAWVATADDARAYVRLGLPRARIHEGMLAKLVRVDAPAAASEFVAARGAAPLCVAGSLHPGEVAVAAKAYTQLCREHPSLRLWIVPRHPERGAAIVAACRRAGLDAAAWPTAKPVAVIAQFNVLAGLYGLANVAWVGGAWTRRGGHNPVEPIAHGVAAIIGPHAHNQRAVMAALPSGAVVQAADADALAATSRRALARGRDEREQLRADVTALAARAQAMARQALQL